jgi:protein O-GlcNAc transferase
MARRVEIGRAAKAASMPLAEALVLAEQHRRAGRLADAQAQCRSILQRWPEEPNAVHLLGLIAHQSGKIDEALGHLRHAVALAPDSALYCANLGEMSRLAGDLDEAVRHARRALELRPNYPEALSNLGIALFGLGEYDEAVACHRLVLCVAPDDASVRNNLGSALDALRRFSEAEASYRHAISLNPGFADAWSNLASLLMVLGRYDEAAVAFGKLCELDPARAYALGNLIHCRQRICSWSGLSELLARLEKGVRDGGLIASPWVMTEACDDADLQRRCAESVIARDFPPPCVPLWRGEIYRHDRIRVAYVSADYHEHPTAYLTAGLFEKHDRTRFEIHAISFGPERTDPMRTRLKRSFDHFLDVSRRTDAEAAALIRSLEIDIAIDLNGFTRDCRTRIFAQRPAPIQINYLGYPGTMGAPYLDYLIADREVVPEDQQSFFSERIIYLPDTYQANDSTRFISEVIPSRENVGLPTDAFVFCCFNKSYKITPQMFDVWMRLLARVPDSVLWLFESDSSMCRNVRTEAAHRGVAPERVIFAPPLNLQDHLARHRLADLFLDTLPYNAHTTASDALWAGLPILTCCGRTFAGRVAASLLKAVDLPELITHSIEDYENLALTLANDRTLLESIKVKLLRNRNTSFLFDTDRFRHHIESAYETVWERQQRGDPPITFAVG